MQPSLLTKSLIFLGYYDTCWLRIVALHVADYSIWMLLLSQLVKKNLIVSYAKLHFKKSLMNAEIITEFMFQWLTKFDYLLILQKTIAINGKGFIELNIWEDLPWIDLINTNGFSKYRIDVTVEEALTGEKREAPSSEFTIERDNFIVIAHNAPTRVEPGKLITYMLVGKKLDGSSLEDKKNIVELRVNDFLYYGFFNKNGIATFNFVLPKPVNAKIYCKYRNTDKYVGNIEAESNDLPPGRFKLNLKSKKYELIKITSVLLIFFLFI